MAIGSRELVSVQDRKTCLTPNAFAAEGNKLESVQPHLQALKLKTGESGMHMRIFLRHAGRVLQLAASKAVALPQVHCSGVHFGHVQVHK